MGAVTFITGNQHKVNYLARYLELPLDYVKIDLDELQSLDLQKIVAHKVRQAYEKLHSPVLVEDVSLEFSALGRLPGPFIKFFLQELPSQAICDLIKDKDRSALGRCAFGYYDGKTLDVLQGELKGTVADHPGGKTGFGWDNLFIPEGYSVTRAELDDIAYRETYMRIKPITALRKLLVRKHAKP